MLARHLAERATVVDDTTIDVDDARDLVDLGADVLITDDRALSSHAASRAPITSQPLYMAAWS
jgi:hypothetical protein